MKSIFKGCITLTVMACLMFQAGLIVAKNKDKRMHRMQDNMKVLLCLLEMQDTDRKLFQKLNLNRDEKVAVYGKGVVGKQIIRQLSREGIDVTYIIDRACSTFCAENMPVYRPDMKLPQVDVVIITPMEDYFSIKEKLEHKIACRFVSVGSLLEAA